LLSKRAELEEFAKQFRKDAKEAQAIVAKNIMFLPFVDDGLHGITALGLEALTVVLITRLAEIEKRLQRLESALDDRDWCCDEHLDILIARNEATQESE